MTSEQTGRVTVAEMCAMCFQDWHESCRDHELLGTCCCGFEDLQDEDDESMWPAMSRVDLDALQKLLDEPLFVLGVQVVAVDDDTARAMAAELRAAREVVDRLDPGHLNMAGNRLAPDGLRDRFYAASNALTAYLAAYPRHVQPSEPDQEAAR